MKLKGTLSCSIKAVFLYVFLIEEVWRKQWGHLTQWGKLRCNCFFTFFIWVVDNVIDDKRANVDGLVIVGSGVVDWLGSVDEKGAVVEASLTVCVIEDGSIDERSVNGRTAVDDKICKFIIDGTGTEATD